VLHLGRLLDGAAAPGDLYARRGRAHAALRQWERALADYSKALEGEPARGDLWAGRAEAAAGLGRWDRAAADYAKATERKGKDAELWLGKGRADAERGQWAKAADDFAKAIRFGRNDPEVWHQQALARLAGGDRAGYRQVCERLVKRVRGEGPAGRAVARTCTLAGDALPDLKPLLLQAEKAVAADPESAADLRRLGALLYRAGQYEAAQRRLQEAARLRGQEPDARDWLFLAMASQRLGRGEEAKTWLDKAVRWIDQAERVKAGDDAGAAPLSWQQRQEYQLLRREAEALVKAPKP
jgi:tetratricopeptide (TPR) repeat protein